MSWHGDLRLTCHYYCPLLTKSNRLFFLHLVKRNTVYQMEDEAGDILLNVRLEKNDAYQVN
jgi:hypothetical protein